MSSTLFASEWIESRIDLGKLDSFTMNSMFSAHWASVRLEFSSSLLQADALEPGAERAGAAWGQQQEEEEEVGLG